MVNVHTNRRSKRPELMPVSLAWSMSRSITTSPWTGCQPIEGLPPGSMSPVPIYSLGWRETKLSKVPSPIKQRNGRGLNLEPPDPEFEVLAARPHTPPLPHPMLTSTCICEKPTIEWVQGFDKGKFNVSECSNGFFSFTDLSGAYHMVPVIVGEII